MPEARSARTRAANTTAARSRRPPAKRLSAAVYTELKARITGGVYAQGEWLSPEALSSEFQVSRQPVMDALPRPAGEWLVEVVPQVGCRVASYERRDCLDYLTVFGDLAGNVAALAAERGTQDQMDLLHGLVDQIGKADHTSASLRAQFFRAIVEMSCSTILIRLSEQLEDFSHFVWLTVSQTGDAEGSPQQDHARVHQVEYGLMRRVAKSVVDRQSAQARRHMTLWWTTYVDAITDTGHLTWTRVGGDPDATDLP